MHDAGKVGEGVVTGDLASPTTAKRAARVDFVAVTAFLLITLPLFALSSGERSPYIKTFASYPAGQGSFGLFGYNYILGDEPVMAENSYYFDQTLMFGGASSKLLLYLTSIRPVYAFLGSLLAPFTGVVTALALVNWLAWGLAAWVAWRFAIDVSGNALAGRLAVVLVAFGLGFVIHVNDYSPHLVPFALYYLALLAIYESRVWAERRPLRVHLFIGAILAVVSLTYSIGLILTVGYVAVSVFRNRWHHVAIAAIIGLTAQHVWSGWLNLLAAIASGNWTWTNVQAVEQDYLARSLTVWRALLDSPPQFLLALWKGTLQFLTFEVPLVVFAGLVSWFAMPRSGALKWFLLVFFSLPIAVGLLFLHNSTARGYLVYCVSLLLYVPLAIGLARLLSASSRSVRIAGLACSVLIIGVQAFWSTAFLWGYIVPAKIFFGFGTLEWMDDYITQLAPPAALSLSGQEPTPAMFGGGATMRDAGIYLGAQPADVNFSWWFGLLARAPLIVYLAVVVWLTVASAQRKWLATAALVLGLWFVPVASAKALGPVQPPVFSTFYALHVPPGETWQYRITVGDDFVDAFRRFAPTAVETQFMFAGIHPPYDVAVTLNDHVVAQASDGRAVLSATVSPTELLVMLESGRQLTVAVTTRTQGQSAQSGTSVFGWQRAGLVGRELISNGDASSIKGNTLPAVEVRLVDGRGRPMLIGF